MVGGYFYTQTDFEMPVKAGICNRALTFIISSHDPLRIKIFKKQKAKPTLLRIPASRLWAI